MFLNDLNMASVISTISMMLAMSANAVSFPECVTPSANQDHHNLTMGPMVLAFKAAAVSRELIIYATIVRTIYQQDLSLTSHVRSTNFQGVRGSTGTV